MFEAFFQLLFRLVHRGVEVANGLAEPRGDGAEIGVRIGFDGEPGFDTAPALRRKLLDFLVESIENSLFGRVFLLNTGGLANGPPPSL